MPGEVLNSQSQMFVIKLLQYFEHEKENGGPLISVLSVQQRVSDTLSVSLRTVQNVKKKYNENPILRTPNKSRNKRKRKTIDASHEVKNRIKSSVYTMYAEKKYLSLSTLQKFLAERHGHEVKQTSLFHLLRICGFEYKKDDNRRALCEQSHIVVLRTTFLDSYAANYNLPTPRTFVFLDETWIFQKGTYVSDGYIFS
ncbi:hypothetical protein FQR65_LT15739 [Abscondita terminalis]|nr:hypothetical protein FQR65_LT15739 [Abscondita terminalis]